MRALMPAIAGSSPHTRGARLFTEYERRGGGSSPHTRGALRLGRDREMRSGIIPAYAGSTAIARFAVTHQ